MTATFYVGDAIEVMGKLPERSVDLILSSPPFLALRSYLPQDHPDKPLEGGSQATPGEYVDWLLDVVEACARVLAPHGSLCFELGDTFSGSGGAGGDYVEDGLREGQPTFKANPGRSGYTKYKKPGYATGIPQRLSQDELPKAGNGWPLAKSLSLIPESFRWAMVYGHNPHTGRKTEPWRLRNVIRWVRPNPPVGALGDKFRPATSELMVFCKAKDRYFDLDAVREPHNSESLARDGRATKHVKGRLGDGDGANPLYDAPINAAGAPPLDWWNIPLLEGEERWWCEKHQGTATFHPVTTPLVCSAAPPIDRNGPVCSFVSHLPDWWEISLLDDEAKPQSDKGKPRNRQAEASMSRGGNWNTFPNYESTHPLGAPPLDWWNIPPGGFSGAHYAVWPPELLIKPIKAMCPEQVCRVCGEPRRRIVGEATYERLGVLVPRNDWTSGISEGKGAHSNKPDGQTIRVAPTLGFSDCGHDDWRPGLVLDPFAGSGTTLAVATGHGRDAIGIDLDERNFELALDRVGPLILQRGTID